MVSRSSKGAAYIEGDVVGIVEDGAEVVDEGGGGWGDGGGGGRGRVAFSSGDGGRWRRRGRR